MTVFEIIGTLTTGKEVHESIEADSEKKAMGIFRKRQGYLKKGKYQIYIQGQLPNLDDYPYLSPKQRLFQTETVDTIIKLAERIRNNTGTSEDYLTLKRYFSATIRTSIKEKWIGMTKISPKDMEDELLTAIITKYIPQYDRARGKFLFFIRMKINGYLMKQWNQETYVNPDKDKSRPRYKEEQYAAMLIQTTPEIDYEEDEETRLITYAKGIQKRSQDLSKDSMEKDLMKYFYNRIVALGLHKRFLKFPKQILTMELYYGSYSNKEREIAFKRDRKQQTIHKTKKRAEQNILTYINKNF
ncbi:hypothetical protein HZF08_01865 [Paenibacillus sp. CGMCC 1.16610]|uniref:RNA polymerase sigma-70 region 2 domain-containing protein n=1 Tax=Paenibacillus anseongense TaxID=2682845 RepID=A0ABW9U4X9_9BACL|nr:MULTISPECIES: hypothetical protein [Paenibacillus]MBA2937047.1 hypothetical protein [Paenibacillus sp. CGMCC 1.16610]MVQ33370.1 hypothetical protein [Paenibacillus anseongense]